MRLAGEKRIKVERKNSKTEKRKKREKRKRRKRKKTRKESEEREKEEGKREKEEKEEKTKNSFLLSLFRKDEERRKGKRRQNGDSRQGACAKRYFQIPGTGSYRTEEKQSRAERAKIRSC